jgi:hypothetical protein
MELWRIYVDLSLKSCPVKMDGLVLPWRLDVRPLLPTDHSE